ncbi:MAG: hypothetical protein ABI460_09045 [Caldimonas sp.]
MFDARHAESAAHGSRLPPRIASLAPIKVSPIVLARIGESFAGSLSALQRSLAALSALPPGAQAVLTAAMAEIGRLEQFGVQIQEVARILGGDAAMARERIDLAQAAREALAQWKDAAQSHHASLRGPSEPFELEVNGAALAQLLDLGLEYALHVGSNVAISAAVSGTPAQPTLSITAQRSTAAAPAGVDELHWLLFKQLGRAAGLEPRRLEAEGSVTLTLGFPDAGAAAATDIAAGQAQLPRTAFAAGRLVLLIEPQDIARVHAYRLMSDAGMRVAAVTSVEKARAGLHEHLPDAVVTGISVDDGLCAALLDDIRAAQPRLRVIELVDDDDAFSFSVPGSNSPARVGRHEMERTLTRAVSQELDAAWPART